ncbi:PD-(D/E)XK nuclease family protein [Mucilaginibacter gossypii]|uniref:PDDEXK-like family protein n=1 Tax=Mucilaginibacter gossypii TaxID=551996 RepID=UPI000DCC3250|nr:MULTISPECIES: PD-(D/E)XK nuclease family protein [Mucilaginibacter]QTE36817.1 PD-(D/E)XK nuclease family protein [Mucilaginibacter gossypii]RAV59196.1 hypothetical protein DIU36_06910 [Mucilaginibacter rubeus]
MELSKYKNLLNQVEAIATRYKKIDELTGESFNVFRILKLESSEVRMHSAFIAELLNPKGSHGQKDTFLKLFINLFCFKGNLLDSMSCKVKVEDNIGKISDDGTEGGRIDISITDKYNHQIIIENKIYASDQKFQLTRYFNYSIDADIVYLTLDGKLPSESSKGQLEEGIHYKSYSYKQDVIIWLEQCRKEVSVYPIVREAITHYINLIRHLTEQTQNQNMQEELSDLLKLHIETSWAISKNLDKACQKVSEDFGKKVESELHKLGVESHYDINFEKRNSGIWIWKPDWEYLNIGFQFQYYDKDMIYGLFAKQDPIKFPIHDALRSKIKKVFSGYLKESDWCPWFRKLDSPYNNWNELEAWQAILDGRMADMIIEKVKYLLNLTNDIEL